MTACIEEKIHKGQRYPRRAVGGRVRYLHRLAWEEKHGPIPEKLELHHLCDNRACVNVTHLRLVTRSEHQRLHRNGPRCKNDLHDMTEENVLWWGGQRLCRACRSAARRRGYEKWKRGERPSR